MKLSTEQRHRLKAFKRRWGRPLFVVSTIPLLTILTLVFHLSVGLPLDMWVLSKMYAVRGPLEPPKDVVIVAIDDESYRVLNASTNYPLPRKYLADALDVIAQNKPRVLIIDAKFPNERMLDPVADQRIAATLSTLPASIWNGEVPGDSRSPHRESVIPSDDVFRRAAKIELPMTIYGKYGYTTFLTDRAVKTDSLHDLVPISKALEILGGYSIKKPGQYDLINFYGPSGTIRRISLHSLIMDRKSSDGELIKDAVVLLGYQSVQSRRGFSDKEEYSTPVDVPGMFGVEIHANSIGNLLHQSQLREVDPLQIVMAIPLFVIAATVLTFRFPTVLTLVGLWGLTLMVVGLHYYLFSRHTLVFSGVSTMVSFVTLVSTCCAIYFFRRASSYKEYVEKTFQFETDKIL
jgi:CHASE2 domain-containing sensor protein